MTTIPVETARAIAADWHGGQASALYQFSSSAVLLIEREAEYEDEIMECLRQAQDPAERAKLALLLAYVLESLQFHRR